MNKKGTDFLYFLISTLAFIYKFCWGLT